MEQINYTHLLNKFVVDFNNLYEFFFLFLQNHDDSMSLFYADKLFFFMKISKRRGTAKIKKVRIVHDPTLVFFFYDRRNRLDKSNFNFHVGKRPCSSSGRKHEYIIVPYYIILKYEK